MRWVILRAIEIDDDLLHPVDDAIGLAQKMKGRG